MIPRELGVGADAEPDARLAAAPLSGRGLVVALATYAALLVPILVVLARPEELLNRDAVITIHLVTGVAGLAGLVALGRPGLAALVPRRWRLRDAAIALVATAIIFGAAQLLIRLGPWVFVELDELYIDPRWSLAAMLLHVALVQATAEELAFRGAILTGLRGLLSDRSAIVATALLSATAHLSVPSLLHLTALGLVLGWTRLRTGSVWPCVLLHAAYNVTAAMTTPT